MMKLDLSQAYRVVKIHPSNYTATGLSFKLPGDSAETIMNDTRLPFGAARSVGIFHRLTQAVRHVMAHNYGYNNVVCYLDDFFVTSPTKEHCIETLNVLLRLLRRLGFWINYNKIDGPSTRLKFLGIILDSVNMSLTLPKDKVQDLKHTLRSANKKSKLTKRHLQQIAGKLNWACQCVYGGRFFLRRIIDSISTLRKPWHRTRVTEAMKADMCWWLQFIDQFNGQVAMVDCRPTTPVYIDACTMAAGAYHQGDFVYTPWTTAWSEVAQHHINYKEVLSLEPAVARWAPLWQNKTVIIHTDNMAAMAIINKGSCRDPETMASLRRVFWLSAVYNFRLHAVYLPGQHNVVADAISRLHEPSKHHFLHEFISSYRNLIFSHCLQACHSAPD